jgi:hypothetical protein
MAKANKKATNIPKVKAMNTDFDILTAQLSDIAVGSEELMPLFSASLKLSITILREYKKAFNAGKKYVK